MTEAEILKLVEGGENFHVEFTPRFTKDVYDTVCSFSNRDGGTILLGVRDNWEIVGVAPDAVKRMTRDFVATISKGQTFYPPLPLQPEVCTVNGRTLLVIQVPPASQVCRHRGRIFERSEEADIDITDNADKVYRLYARKTGNYYVNKVTRFQLDDLRPELIERARRMTACRTQNHPWKAMSDEELLRSAGLSVLIAVFALIGGVILGTLGAAGKISKNKVLNTIATVYVEVFRGTPMMLQAAFIYYGMSSVFGINLGMWSAAIIIVSINTGAYMAETVRGGILSVDPGQREGAMAIGMSHMQTMVYIVLPQALRNIMPQIGNNLIINIKDTCVLSIIGTVELFFTFRSISGALYTYFEAATVTMIIYFVLTFTCSRILRAIESKMDGPANFDLATSDTLAFTSGMNRYNERTGGTH